MQQRFLSDQQDWRNSKHIWTLASYLSDALTPHKCLTPSRIMYSLAGQSDIFSFFSTSRLGDYTWVLWMSLWWVQCAYLWVIQVTWQRTMTQMTQTIRPH